MNCNPGNRSAYLIAKMLGWRELELYGADRFERLRGRRNLNYLLQAHPEIAVDCRFAQAVRSREDATNCWL